jgi:hypothetical protein
LSHTWSLITEPGILPLAHGFWTAIANLKSDKVGESTCYPVSAT